MGVIIKPTWGMWPRLGRRSYRESLIWVITFRRRCIAASAGKIYKGRLYFLPSIDRNLPINSRLSAFLFLQGNTTHTFHSSKGSVGVCWDTYTLLGWRGWVAKGDDKNKTETKDLESVLYCDGTTANLIKCKDDEHALLQQTDIST